MIRTIVIDWDTYGGGWRLVTPWMAWSSLSGRRALWEEY